MSDLNPCTLRKAGALTVLVTAVLGTGCASRIAYVRPPDPRKPVPANAGGQEDVDHRECG